MIGLWRMAARSPMVICPADLRYSHKQIKHIMKEVLYETEWTRGK